MEIREFLKKLETELSKLKESSSNFKILEIENKENKNLGSRFTYEYMGEKYFLIFGAAEERHLSNDINTKKIWVSEINRDKSNYDIQFTLAEKLFIQEGFKVEVRESYVMNVGQGNRTHDEVKRMLEGKGFSENGIIISCDLSKDDNDWEEIFSELFEWIKIRIEVKRDIEKTSGIEKEKKDKVNNIETFKTKDMQTKPNLNTILYGPPGTGKTYNTVNKAIEIIDKEKFDQIKTGDRSALMKLFNEYKDNDQIVFTTFHQNYTYEDFMIGIKPDTVDEGLSFREHKGVFYNLAEKAKDEFETKEEDNFDKIYQKLIEEYQAREDEYVLLTPVQEKKFTIVLDSNNNFRAIPMTGIGTKMTVKKEWLRDYLLNGRIYDWKPYVIGISEKLKELGFEKGKKKLGDKKNYVLIIDEINRANISKVFGELITLLEDDKRLGAENELMITLPNGEKFGVPPNLYVIGTMNTADKSIALIDIALRRRFHYEGKYPDSSLITDSVKKDFLIKVNEEIYKKKKSADWLIGHAYFMKDEDLDTIIMNRIIPLLMEYFGNKTEEVQTILKSTNSPYKFNEATFVWEKSAKQETSGNGTE